MDIDKILNNNKDTVGDNKDKTVEDIGKQSEDFEIPGWADSCSLDNSTLPCPDGTQCSICLRNQDCPEGIGECFPCLLGDICVNGTRNPYAWTKNSLCPAGELCRNTTITEPCPAGYFCPSGTFFLPEPLICPDDKGVLCEEGSSLNITNCPEGYYCPDSTKKIICPEGYFCKNWTITPTECNYGSSCPQGSASAKPSTVGVVGSVVSILAGLSIIFIVELFMKKRQRKQDEKMKMQVLVKSTAKSMLARLLGVPPITLAQEVQGFSDCERPITIHFKELKLTLGKKVLLNCVSGHMFAGSLTAVMGPSGSGKSTLLNTITGKATYAKRVGEISINGNSKVDLDEDLQKVVGFVPQDDTVFAQLTVWENLMFAARLTLSKDKVKDKPKLMSIVAGAIEVLGLENVQNSIVGSVDKRGISGGQKKRVNIGWGLCADPTVLFLDEPTSGLGATDTLLVMKACRSFAFLKRTVAAVIHQPRYSVFILFDEVIILGVGGNDLYCGPTSNILNYFKKIGFSLPENENPADFFLDCVSGQVATDAGVYMSTEQMAQSWDQYVSSGEYEADIAAQKLLNSQNLTEDGLPITFVDKLKTVWTRVDKDNSGTLDVNEFGEVIATINGKLRKKELKYIMELFDSDKSGTVSLQEVLHLAGSNYKVMHASNIEEMPQYEGNPGDRERLGFGGQFLTLLERAWIQWLRDFRLNAVDVFLVMVAGTIVGSLLGSNWGYEKIPGNSCMSTVCIGVLSTVASLKLFGEERVLFWREKAAGVNTFSYFMAKNVVNVVDNIWRPILFLSLYYNFLLPRMYYKDYVVILLLVCWACSGVGILLSQIFKPTAALLMGVLFPLVTGVFLAGVSNPPLGQMTPGLKIISAISFSRWASEAIMIKELREEPESAQFRIEILMDFMGYKDEDYNGCLIALVVMGFAYRLLAYLLMSDHVRNAIEDISERVEDTIPDLGIDDMVEDVVEDIKEGVSRMSQAVVNRVSSHKKEVDEDEELVGSVKSVNVKSNSVAPSTQA
eukprot:CAMPEP_0197845972 /NCGR_PEP_ID=MMETSP1438-20131217/2811_1 /TAXON_ID=1461541 /ORGANISM="Pterosperma sp., Strain CCMP1384" /LENGTH=1014 /DNA_ID=CAMNT_0043457463 /DNA_START=226 /DNA_END=3270 /DNA_ORIENTATION=+